MITVCGSTLGIEVSPLEQMSFPLSIYLINGVLCTNHYVFSSQSGHRSCGAPGIGPTVIRRRWPEGGGTK